MSKRAQCGQETEAYSIIVTLAVGEPMDMSSAATAPEPVFWQAPRETVRQSPISRAAMFRMEP